MPGLKRIILFFIAALLLYSFYLVQGLDSDAQSHDATSHGREGFGATARPTSLHNQDTGLVQDGDNPSKTPMAIPADDPKDNAIEFLEEPKWYFQDDLPFANPSFDIPKLRRYSPHNYKGPGRDTFATYLATRNSTLQDPYFQAAQQLTYRILWDPKSRSNEHPFTVFVAPFISPEQRNLLSAAGAMVRELELVEGHTPVPGFGRWRDLFSKLNLWSQTDYKRIAFLDVDAFPIQNIDGIFEAATPQKCQPRMLPAEDSQAVSKICDYYFSGVSVGSSDQINVGVVVLSPNSAMHQRLLRESERTENFDNTMAEQAFLNYAFRPDGPFPMELISREWNGFFPQMDEIGWLKVIHEKLWAIERTGESGLQWLKDYFGDTWVEMLSLYDSRRFEKMRAADGLQ